MQIRRVKLSEGDRLAIPSSFRNEMGIGPGDTVMVELKDGELRIRSVNTAVARVQGKVRALNPAGRSLVDELIAERKSAAGRE